MPSKPPLLPYIVTALILVFVCVGIWCVVTGIAIANSGPISGNCLYKVGSQISPQWFKDFAGVDLPPSARNITASCETFQDYVAYARFTIDPKDVNRLIASSFIKTPLSSTNKPFDMTEHYNDMRQLVGWDIGSISSYLAGEADVKPPNPLHQSILIDTSNASQYIVYVVTFG